MLTVEAGEYKGSNVKRKVEGYFGSNKVTFVQPMDIKKPLMIVPSFFTGAAMRNVLNGMSEEEEDIDEFDDDDDFDDEDDEEEYD